MSGLIARWSRLSTLAASAGASLIGFIQAGAGAVARTLQAKARDVVSVKDFGAVGDGVIDDTVSIQSAIDYAVPLGKRVFIPAANYKISVLVLPLQAGGICIYGEAYTDSGGLVSGAYKGTVLVSTTAAGNVISCAGGAGYSNRGIRISDMAIVATTAGNLIHLDGAPELTELTGLALAQKGSGGGIYARSCWSALRVSGCMLYGGAVSGAGIKLLNAIPAGQYLIENTSVYTFNNGIEVGTSGARVYNVTIGAGVAVEYARNVGLLYGETNTLNICGVHFEGNLKAAIANNDYGTSTGVSVRGCSFFRNGEMAANPAEIALLGGHYNLNIDISGNDFMGLGAGVAGVYLENADFSTGKIDNNIFIEYAALARGVAVGSGSVIGWSMRANAFSITGVSVASPHLFGVYEDKWGVRQSLRLPNTVQSSSGVLTWYEQGNLVPELRGTGGTGSVPATTPQLSGTFERIGKVVHFTAHIYWTAVGTWAGNALIAGLPYAAKALAYGSFPCTVCPTSIVLGASKVPIAAIDPSSNIITMRVYDAAAGTISAMALPGVGLLTISGSYPVA